MLRAMAIAGFVVMWTGSALAADLSDAVEYQCVPMTPSAQLAAIDSDVALVDEVVRMMNEAVIVADDPAWQAYSRPAFTWASEAKVACGKAFGYLQSSYRDQQYLDKCECFYRRMQYYMN